MDEKKFDPKKLQKLNNPKRLEDIPPAWIGAKLGESTPEVMIDVGAGTGFITLALRNQLRPATTYACDLSQTMLDWLEENVQPENPDLIAVKTEEDVIPLDDGIGDLVFMINLHHELHNPTQTLKECKRLLRPGGKLAIIDWKKEEMAEGPPLKIRCTIDEVAAQMSNGGFVDVVSFQDLKKHFLVTGTRQ